MKTIQETNESAVVCEGQLRRAMHDDWCGVIYVVGRHIGPIQDYVDVYEVLFEGVMDFFPTDMIERDELVNDPEA